MFKAGEMLEYWQREEEFTYWVEFISVGSIVKLVEINSSGGCIVEANNKQFWLSLKNLRRVKTMKPIDYIKNGYIVETRCGHLFRVEQTEKYGTLLCCAEGIEYLECYNDELLYINSDYTDVRKKFAIIKIYEPENANDYAKIPDEAFKKIVWEREETKEMTIEEIEKQLGYKIKVVGNGD